MEQRPFQCSKCGNWYTPVPIEEGESCGQCALGTHTPHLRTGIVDCHYGQKSSTASEVRMVGVINAVKKTLDDIAAAQRLVGRARTQSEVVSLLGKAEASVASTEQTTRDVPEILTWAGIFEMPGMVGENPKMRFKDQAAIEELVGNNRRPREDLEELRRSVRVCQVLAAEVPTLMAEIRVAVGQVRQMASEWRAPAPAAKQAVAKRRTRKVRVQKRVNQEPVAVPA